MGHVGQNLKGPVIICMLGREPRRRTHLTETFESEGPEHTSSRFMMDRTLYKGIKQNDVSKIIDIGNDGGNLGEKEFLSEEQELEAIVIEMRKKYDEIKTGTSQLEIEIQKSRKAAQMLKSEEEKLTNHVNSTKARLQSVQRECENITELVEARSYDLDIYKEMMERLKKDILVIKKRNFDKDYLLKKESIKVKTLKQDEFNKTKLSYKCRDMLQSIERAVVTKQQERTTKINSFYDALNRRHQNLVKREERDRQIEEVMMKAMSQKLQEEKEWINICFANLFLKKFLKNKMEILIRQNQEIETAYHKIRSSTDIKDCQDLITRFLNRQRDYGILLQSISEKERRVEDLKQEKQTLQKNHQEFKQQTDEIIQSVNRNIQNVGPLQKQIQKIQQALKAIKEKSELISKWGFRFLCAYSGKSKEHFQQKYETKTVKELIVDVLRQINKYTDSILGDENCSDKINNAFMSTRPSNKILDDEMIIRNKRVKTSAMEDSANDPDDREAFYDGNSEADYLQYNRRLTKKNDYNRRFRIKTQLK